MIEQIFYQDAGDNMPMQLLQIPSECQVVRGALEAGGLSLQQIPGRDVYLSALGNTIFNRLKAIASPGLGSGDIEFVPFKGRGGFSIGAELLESELRRCISIIQTQRELAEDALRTIRQAMSQASNEPADPQDRLMARARAIQKSEKVSFAQAWDRVAKQAPEDLAAYQNRLRGAGPDPRQAAGDRLTAIAKEIMADKGVSFGPAFEQACRANPELARKYRRAV
jgi:hypothetical protein